VADAEILKATNLHGWFSAAQIGIPLFGALSALCLLAVALIPLLAQHQYERDLRKILTKDGLHRDIWFFSEQKLIESKFSRNALGSDFVLYERRATDTKPLEAVIKRRGVTLAIADIIAVDDQESWSYGLADRMTDGSDVASALSRSAIPMLLAQRSDDPVDVVAVGIVSLASNLDRSQPTQVAANGSSIPSLSYRRAAALAHAFTSNADFIRDRPVQYWTLELGVSKVAKPLNAPEEIRQRAAIVVALSRRIDANIEGLSREDALAMITTNVSVYGTALSEFENSEKPGSFLKPWTVQ
jgi:hypothetical protein